MARRQFDLYPVRKVEESPKNVPVESIQPAPTPETQTFNESVPSEQTKSKPEGQEFHEALPMAAAYQSIGAAMQIEEAHRARDIRFRVTFYNVALLLSGLWLTAAPALLRIHTSKSFFISTTTVGICLAIVAIVHAFRLIGNNLFAFLSLLGGVVLLATPLLFSAGSDKALWNNITLGYIVLGTTLLTLLVTDSDEA